MKKKKKPSSVERYFRNYLRIGPLGLALWRSVEAKHVGKVKLKHPILDIGCGFGEFAVAFAEEQIEMGTDLSSRDLYIAAKTNKYKNLTLADARDLPFADNSYASIFSISTIEHITHPELVMKEAYRVLKPGGIFVLTIETNEVDSATFYRPLMDRIGLPWLKAVMSTSYDRLFHRHTLLAKKEWIKTMKKPGFIIEKSQDIISPTVNRLFDFLLITAWPSQVLRPLIGKRVVFRPKFIEDALVHHFLRYVEEDEKTGTNLLVIARKPL